MIDPALAPVVRTIQGIGAKLIEMQARLDAVESFAVYLAMKQGTTQAAAQEALEKIKRAAHQKRLEEIESKNPEAAAEFDNRPDMPDLPDEAL